MAVATLPEFKDPPLTEVALSVQFSPMSGLTPMVIPQVWDLYRKRFPKGQAQPPLAVAFEIFGTHPIPQQLSLEAFHSVPPLRYWFLDEAEQQLIQVQWDRFVHNWRKQAVGDKYPRYEAMRTDFETEIRAFADWSERALGQPVVPNQCEVTYVNQITLDGGGTWKRLHEIVRYWQPFEPELALENARIATRFLLPNPKNTKGEPIGRLHVSIEPMHRGQEELVQLTLTARGAPIAQSIDAAMEFLDAARLAVGKCFVQITTDKMQNIWGRIS